jgi:MOSC domain-containing protein YiiM
MRLQLLSVNVSLPKPLGERGGETVLSGIAKEPVSAERVHVRRLNIAGDGQADLTVHGGVDKAVYAYPADHWPWWNDGHGYACKPATFGENLTTSGAVESDVAIGDRFRWGDAVLEVSQPRAPCYKFALHVRHENGPLMMTLSARSGWYLRVIEEGDAPAVGGMLERIAQSGGPTVREAFVAAMHPTSARELRQRVHETAALAQAWRKAVAKRLGNPTD